MISLKPPSLLSFREQTKQEEKNLKATYHIQSVPVETQMRAPLDPPDLAPSHTICPRLFNQLNKAGVLKKDGCWKGQVIVSVDGVEYFSSMMVHCDHCKTRTHLNGETSYHHAGLAAVLVHPDREEVFTLDFEPILNVDGARQNDCQRNAAKRLFHDLHNRYPYLKQVMVGDAVYANAPHIRQITSYGWLFALNDKTDSHESLVRQFAGRRASGQVRELRITD